MISLNPYKISCQASKHIQGLIEKTAREEVPKPFIPFYNSVEGFLLKVYSPKTEKSKDSEDTVHNLDLGFKRPKYYIPDENFSEIQESSDRPADRKE